MKRNRICGILVLILIILIQGLLIGRYWNKETQKSEYVKNEYMWSSMEGKASGRLAVSGQNPVVTQSFVNQYERLNGIIVFFYHCDEAHSGQIYARIKDMEGNTYYEYKFEPLYMEAETFCLSARLEEQITLTTQEEYYLEITAENMEEGDYVEVGTTLKASKPSVFHEMQDGNTLFMKLDYSFVDISEVERSVQKTIVICMVVDCLLVLGYLFAVEKKKRLTMGIVSVAVVAMLVTLGVKIYAENQKWYNQYSFIAHAMGGIDDKVYTNSLEAFENSYLGGHRVFEVDFAMTSDRKIVLKHDWTSEHGLPEFENGAAPAWAEFKAAKIWGKYTTMDIDDLLQLMLEYPDIYVVTDSKSSDYKDVVEQFEQIDKTLQNYSPEEREHVIKHFIVQIYNDDMYAGIESITHFENYIYTLYQRGCSNLEELAEFCVKKEIPVVTIPYSWWTQEISDTLKGYGLKVWVHTLNEQEEIEEFLAKDVDGIYTDAYQLP